MSTFKGSDPLTEESLQVNKRKIDESSNSAKIISNELLHSAMYDGAEKIDELTSLEREIAEMHHVEPSSGGQHGTETFQKRNETDKQKVKFGQLSLKMETENSSSISESCTGRTECDSLRCDLMIDTNIAGDLASPALKHEDLIAVLQGIDDHNITDVADVNIHDNAEQSVRPPSVTDSELAEGVTIEGEGQFQIMEVVDDELEEFEHVNDTAVSKCTLKDQPTSSSPVLSSGIVAQTQVVSHLTNEEIRAMAMEQMAGLNAVRHRRRKQDIKPLQIENSGDLVSSLGADWSDDDTEPDLIPASNVDVSKKLITNVGIRDEHRINRLDENVDDKILEEKQSISKTGDSKPNLINTVGVEGGNLGRSLKKVPSLTDVERKKNDIAVKPTIGGFKRTRIIKRKIIWDPDAPETQITYAQLARNTSKVNVDINPKKSTATAMSPSVESIVPVSRKESAVKTKGPDASKNQKLGTKDKKLAGAMSPSLRQPVANKKSQCRESAKGNENPHLSPTPQSQRIKSSDTNVKRIQSPVKRRSQTPVTNGIGGAAGAKKKRVSEIDRLVSDEGAANMLHSLESERNKLIAEQGDDKPHKPLMRSRAATISERIIKSETTSTSGKVAIVTTSGGTKKGRISKQKPSSTWDYVYKQQASEDAMIIRRRSNSSYSSNASIRRLSLDGPVTSKVSGGTKSSLLKCVQQNPTSAIAARLLTTTAKSTQRSLLKTTTENNSGKESAINDKNLKINTANSKNSFEFAKPELKSNQKSNRRTITIDTKKPTMGSCGRRVSRSPATIDGKDKDSGIGVANKVLKEDVSASSISDVVVRKAAKVAQIIFNTQRANINYTFTAQLMNKLVDILDKLGKDVECNAVVIITNAPHFCYGVDFTDLAYGTIEKRKHAAIHLATAVKNYLKTLATFPKPLVAGVNGSNIGLGVMQLPLFDIVIGSDKGSYETPYMKIGQSPEGYCIWNNITKIRDNYKTKLFWLGEKLHSTESALSGIVNKLTAPGKVNEDAVAAAKKIAAMSPQSYRFMKKTVIRNYLETIITALDEEFEIIIEQWTSTECYENFKKYLEIGHF